MSAQPLGAFPYPAGLMLVPEDGGEEAAAAAASLIHGRIPAPWPAAMEPHRLAHLGDVEAALGAIDGTHAFSAYNRFVLGDRALAPAAVAASLPAQLRPLVDLVVFTNGGSDRPPEVPEAGDEVVKALILAARASYEMTRARADITVELLRQAAASVTSQAPTLAALLIGNAGTVSYSNLGNLEQARADLTAATAALTDTDLTLSRAELHYQLGTVEHEFAAGSGGSLQVAMHQYYTALQLITRDDSPFLWASAQLNLATAYLASPMVQASDTLRTGIAIQALRAALEVFTADQHPAEWATATLNLANALIYAPSVKQGDNLVEAVELYERVLELRGRERDPLGRARVLANQGNALAHLGIFDQAKAKLFEARFLFEEHLDHDAALAVRSVLDEITKSTTMQRAG